ncbi:MAG: nuclear transport factor 2 family protein [Pseudomonadota bacterium]
MARRSHQHPTSRASVVAAVCGIFSVALGVAVLVPVALNWPASWPGVLVTIGLVCLGVVLIARHIARHKSEGCSMTREEALVFAGSWATAWNRRDVEQVLGYFRDDCTFTSPTALVVVGSATVQGKAALRAYWAAALARIGSLHFTVDRVVWDAAAREVAVIYVSNVDGQSKRISENFIFGLDGLVVSAEVFHGVGG